MAPRWGIIQSDIQVAHEYEVSMKWGLPSRSHFSDHELKYTPSLTISN